MLEGTRGMLWESNFWSALSFPLILSHSNLLWPFSWSLSSSTKRFSFCSSFKSFPSLSPKSQVEQARWNFGDENIWTERNDVRLPKIICMRVYSRDAFSLNFWNSIMAFLWNSSTYLCYIFSYLFVSSRNLPKVKLLSVLSPSIFLPSLYFSSSSAWRISFSLSALV